MSFRRTLWVFVAAVCLAAPVAVQAQGDYLDVLIVKAKSEKLADFQALNKKVADANRRFNGDRWIAMESVYGDANVYQFTSTRKDYAEIDTGNDVFVAALSKAFGKEAAQKMEMDFNSCVIWSRTELRRRRWDLSTKAPQDAEAYAKLIGESRLLRTTAVHIRPGHVPEFEAMMKEAKEVAEKNSGTAPLFVSQVIEGGKGPTFYLSTLRSSMGGFDHNPTLREVLGDEGFKKIQQVAADTYETTESTLFRFNAEMSSPTEEIAKVAADFWHPRGALAASTTKPKPKTAMTPVSAKDAPKKP